MIRRHNEIGVDYVRVIAPEKWHSEKPAQGLRHVLSPLLAGLELKTQTPTFMLCVRLADAESKKRSLTGVFEPIEAEYWAWRGKWAVFTRRVATSPRARDYILALDPVYREPAELERLAITQGIVRSVLAAQACTAALEGLK